jgi:UDPglucose 6-dehydrogenase
MAKHSTNPAEGPTGFLGLSHLGLVAAIGWASLGCPVIGVDPDRACVDPLERSELPIIEPGLADLLARHGESIQFSSDLSDLSKCPLVIISRDVPTDENNISDQGAIASLVDTLIPHLQEGVTLVCMSQLTPGTTRGIFQARVQERRPGLSFSLFYWVETLIIGSAVERFLKPERLIVGCDDPGKPLPPRFEDALKQFSAPVLKMSYESAELTKMAINLYLCAAVTYGNSLSDLCEAIGADWSEVMPALRLDQRIGQKAYIRPGLGISGGNLERDMVALRNLCRENSVDGAFIETMVSYNDRRHQWALQKLKDKGLGDNSSEVIAVWGLAYKKNTRSIKNSLSLRVIRELKDRVVLKAFDPEVKSIPDDGGVLVAENAVEALEGADALLILTDWDDFGNIEPKTMRALMKKPLVIDCVGILEADKFESEGIEVVSMGRRHSGK